MGSITDKDMRLPFITSSNYEKAKQISRKIVTSLFEDGQMFKGVMYVQFMQTASDLKVIEVNGRLGDPEGMNILTLMNGDSVDLLFRIANAEISGAKINFRKNATTLKYLVPPGYGVNPEPGNLNVNLAELPEHVKVYYSSVNGDLTNVVMTGSRSLAILAEGNTIEESSENVEKNLWRVNGKFKIRHDIGTYEMLQNKINACKNIKN
jgi:Phosphoribosylamine-glycine ligase